MINSLFFFFEDLCAVVVGSFFHFAAFLMRMLRIHRCILEISPKEALSPWKDFGDWNCPPVKSDDKALSESLKDPFLSASVSVHYTFLQTSFWMVWHRFTFKRCPSVADYKVWFSQLMAGVNFHILNF